MGSVLDILRERGFVEQVSNETGLRQALEHPLTLYNGYDPTARSFHVGHLVTIMAFAHLQRAGHRPIALVGGGTGMVGDPSGRSEMRKLLSVEQIQSNVDAQKKQLQRFIDFGPDKAIILNNAEWLCKLNYVEFLRDIGRHFSVNRMLAAETYKTRYENDSLSFLEFNYQLFQAYDYLYLYRNLNCTLQLGGNDQWGNILAGVDLIRRVEGVEVYALTYPLLTTSSGAKMGKTAQGAVWLDAELLSPYDFYQYWINTSDADVEKLFKIFTFLPLVEILQLANLPGAEIRQAKERLAYEVTSLVHGAQEAEKARDAARSLFAGEGQGEAVPTTELSVDELAAGIPLARLMQRVGLAKTLSDARRLIEQGGAYLNEQPITSVDAVLTIQGISTDSALLRAGKKRYHRIVLRK
jgi:tyrosyl-tRNA synthetase